MKNDPGKPIVLSDDEDIALQSATDLGLSAKPDAGDACSIEGAYTCGIQKLVLKCVDGTWRNTSRGC
jgi:hypothetical protein